MSTTGSTRSVDVLIVGAGISGIGMACHLTRELPDLSYALLEQRDAVGGTWDLFRYPGIRSDSDMLTFGYGFRPWHGTKVLSDGAGIREYVAETAEEYAVTDHISFGRTVRSASWSSEREVWTVRAVDVDGAEEIWECRFLVGATGYYDYSAGHRPCWPGEDGFRGTFVHPQEWPEDLDVTGKRVVVIGSGATAISLVPELAKTAASVTMLQRTPTYIATVPAIDPVAALLERARVPKALSYPVGRLRNIGLQQAVYRFCRKAPRLSRRLLLAGVRAQVGPDIDLKHFDPPYMPWDERLCVVPNGDLFRVLRSGAADIVTDHIATFTETGIELESGEVLDADIVVTATGLRIQVLGGIRMDVDGEVVDTRERMLYQGVLIDGVPNAAIILGYTNASWTLKADLAATYVCRLLRHMAVEGHGVSLPSAEEGVRGEVSVMGASMRSGYIQRGDAVMPRQGTRDPWMIRNDYFRDRPVLRRGPVATKELQLTRRAGD